LRRIKLGESESAQTTVIVTHNSALPAQAAWALQNSRRRMELFLQSHHAAAIAKGTSGPWFARTF
jgi:hypothetical protein